MNQVRYLRPSISAAPKQTEPEVERRSASGLPLCGGNYPSVQVVTFPLFLPLQKSPVGSLKQRRCFPPKRLAPPAARRV